MRDVFGSKKSEVGSAAHIVCHRAESLAEARVLQTALSKRCGRRVDIGEQRGEDGPTRVLDSADALVLLLTKSTLHSPDCLAAAVEAIHAGKPIISVLLQGRGYDFAANQLLLQDLRGGLASGELTVFERLLAGLAGAASQLPTQTSLPGPAILPPPRSQDLSTAQAKLLDTIPNVIAINWHPEGGDNQLAAVVEDVNRRLPSAPSRPKTAVRSARPLSKKQTETSTIVSI